MDTPLQIRSWPRAILHVDGDAFFASCEQAINPSLKGKPVITGKERGIVSAASYEAKAFGISRGIRLSEVKKLCPQAIILPSDYETYSLFSKRMFEIVRRFTSEVEEYSIDEAFADLTGLRRPLNDTYGGIAKTIKNQIESELGITVSIGVSLSKVLAKVGSKFKKPSGLVIISGKQINQYLRHWPVEKIWGIGPSTTAYLKKFNITTSLEFAQKPFEFIQKYFTKPHQEIWQELNGFSVYPIITTLKTDYVSISKTRTFTPASAERSFIYAQLIRNLEGACLKARRHNLVAKRIMIFLKTQQFKVFGLEASLNRQSAMPNEITPLAKSLFERIFSPGAEYRATGVVLADLQSAAFVQRSLFEPVLKLETLTRLYHFVDQVNSKYGKSTLHLLSGHQARITDQHAGERGLKPERYQNLLPGETGRKHLGLPMINKKLL